MKELQEIVLKSFIPSSHLPVNSDGGEKSRDASRRLLFIAYIFPYNWKAYYKSQVRL